MEEYKEIDELQEMRQQMLLLKARLDKETNLREEVLRKTLKRGANKLKKRELSSMVLVVAVMLFMPPMLHVQHFSNYFSIATFLYFAFALVWEIVVYRRLKIGHLMQEDLISAARNLQEYKRINRIWLFKVAPPTVLIWFAWYVLEFLHTVKPEMEIFTLNPYNLGFICGVVGCLLIGGFIGGIIGYFTFYAPQMRLADEMMEQINSLTSEN